jgi:putative hydrolase of the HAD superfamily
MKSAIFDLDNTLYDSAQYYSGAFSEVAEYLAGKYTQSRKNIYEKLMRNWRENTSMYPHLFNDLLNELGIENEVKNIVEIFNNYNGTLELYPGTYSALEELKSRGFKLGIITDGTVHRQKRKIKSLEINSLFDSMVFTKELGHSKLTEVPFRKALDELKVFPEDSIYVGDNPHLDFKGAKAMGVKTVRILQGEFRHVPKDKYIDHEISKITELIGLA